MQMKQTLKRWQYSLPLVVLIAVGFVLMSGMPAHAVKFSKLKEAMAECVNAAKNLGEESDQLMSVADTLSKKYDKHKETTLQRAKEKKSKKKKLAIPAGKKSSKAILGHVKDVKTDAKAVSKKCKKLGQLLKEVVIID